MCGRFTLTVDPDDLQTAFPFIRLPLDALPAPRYNIAPSQPVAAIANTDPPRLDHFRWGLIPSWAKDPSIGNRLINARAETLADKPAFRSALKRRRCLIPADGFYEWRKAGSGKTPMYIRMKSGEPFAFAGLWEAWSAAGDKTIVSCAIITTTPNALLEKIHDRMPVILKPEAYAGWLDPGEGDPGALAKWLKPYPAAHMTAYAVSPLVNKPANDVPECIVPVK